jgi:hypothetical protein
MDERRVPMDPRDAARRFAAMLAEAGLPCFTSSFNAPETADLRLGWDNGFRLHIDLTRDDWDPIDDWERKAILAEPIHVSVAGDAEDPRTEASIPGVLVHRGPPLHPDDVTTHLGLPVTSPSRTLIDCAEHMTPAELRTSSLAPGSSACSILMRCAQHALGSNGARRWRCSMKSSTSSVADPGAGRRAVGRSWIAQRGSRCCT